MTTNGILAKVRLIAWVLAGAAVFAGGAVLIGALHSNVQKGDLVPAAARIGGPFELTAHTGETFSSEQLKGKPHLIFFGFTHCPDICPTTLLEMSNHLKALGEDADKLEALYITVDPARDTVEHLKLYLSAFDPRITGLTGSEDKIQAVMKAYRAFARKVPSENDPEDYTMDHSATVYLFDEAGKLAGTLDWQEDPKIQLKKLKRLVGQPIS